LSKRKSPANEDRTAFVMEPYNASFRPQAVELLLSNRKPQLEVARDLGICVETLRAWKQQQERKPNVGVVASANTAGDLERENQRLRRN
jgi:transposase-like protein